MYNMRSLLFQNQNEDRNFSSLTDFSERVQEDSGEGSMPSLPGMREGGQAVSGNGEMTAPDSPSGNGGMTAPGSSSGNGGMTVPGSPSGNGGMTVPGSSSGNGGMAAPGLSGNGGMTPGSQSGNGEQPGNGSVRGRNGATGGNRPVIPLPNPGEGGPVSPGGNQPGNGGNRPVIPLPNPGEGGPVSPGGNQSGNGGNRPVIPLPNPGEGGPVAPGGITIPAIIGTIITTFPRPNAPCRFCGRPGQNTGMVRFLNAASNYNPFRVFFNDMLFVNALNFSEVTTYERVPSGYQIVTVMGEDQYIYIQKPVMIPQDSPVTVCICNTETGLDLFVVGEGDCRRGGMLSCVRVCNLSFNSGPLSMVIGNNDLRFMNVSFQEVTSYRVLSPAEYVFYVINGNRNILLSSTVNIKRNANYTMYLFNWNVSSPDAVTVLMVEEQS